MLHPRKGGGLILDDHKLILSDMQLRYPEVQLDWKECFEHRIGRNRWAPVRWSQPIPFRKSDETVELRIKGVHVLVSD